MDSPYPLNVGACRYMAESMAMTEPYDNQEQNFILGHLVTFASDLYEALVMVRDADNDCLADGFSAIPASARLKIDAAIAVAEGTQS